MPENELLYTLQDISLACCSSLCCFGVVGFWIISSIAARAGTSASGFLGGIIGGGGLFSLFGLTQLADLAIQFLGGGDDDGPPQPPQRNRRR